MDWYIKFIIFSALILLLFCSRQEKETVQRNDELSFEVDTTKIEVATRLVDLGIQLNSPKGWKPIADRLFAELSEKTAAVNLSDSVFSCKPVAIFLNHQTNSLLFISSVPGLDDTSSLATYKNLIQEQLAPRKAGDFLKDQVHFSQFLIQNEQHVNFKLIFQNNKHHYIQFDYIIPIHSYVSELKAIEASIGSITVINPE